MQGSDNMQGSDIDMAGATSQNPQDQTWQRTKRVRTGREGAERWEDTEPSEG